MQLKCEFNKLKCTDFQFSIITSFISSHPHPHRFELTNPHSTDADFGQLRHIPIDKHWKMHDIVFN